MNCGPNSMTSCADPACAFCNDVVEGIRQAAAKEDDRPVVDAELTAEDLRELEALAILRGMGADMKAMLELMRLQARPRRVVDEEVRGGEPPAGWPDFFEATEALSPDATLILYGGKSERSTSPKQRTIAERLAAIDGAIEGMQEWQRTCLGLVETSARQFGILAEWAKEVSKVIGLATDKVNGIAGESAPATDPIPRGNAWDGRVRALNGTDEPCNCDACVQAHRNLYPTGNCGDLACLVCVPDPR